MIQSRTPLAAMATLAIACGGSVVTPGDFDPIASPRTDASTSSATMYPSVIEASVSSDSQGSGAGGFSQEAALESGPTLDSRATFESAAADSATRDSAAERGTVDDGSSIKCLLQIGRGLTCGDLCSAFFKVCKNNPGTMNAYADKAACLTVCKTLNQEQLCCRAQHAVTIASIEIPTPSDIVQHCPHAIGVSPCT